MLPWDDDIDGEHRGGLKAIGAAEPPGRVGNRQTFRTGHIKTEPERLGIDQGESGQSNPLQSCFGDFLLQGYDACGNIDGRGSLHPGFFQSMDDSTFPLIENVWRDQQSGHHGRGGGKGSDCSPVPCSLNPS